MGCGNSIKSVMEQEKREKFIAAHYQRMHDQQVKVIEHFNLKKGNFSSLKPKSDEKKTCNTSPKR